MKQVLDINDVSVNGYSQRITLRSYLPAATKTLPVVLCFHGGNFVGGCLNDNRPLAIQLAQTLPAWVVSVGYSLAPDFPFPAAAEDAYLALKWVVEHAASYRADGQRIAAVGIEAGGNIAASLAAMARDRAVMPLRAQVLMAPLLDPSMTRVANVVPASADDQRARACAEHYRAYLPAVSDRTHPYAAPLESKRLAHLPPTLVASAGRDVFRADGEAYARELIPAGVPVVATRSPGIGAQEIAGHTPAVDDAVGFLRQHLGRIAR